MGNCFSSNALVPLPAGDGAQERTIMFTKTDDVGLGLQAKPNCHGEAVVIEIFDGGMVQIWNHRNPGSKVKRGDRIISVNDVKSFWPMVFELQSKGIHVIAIKDGTLDEFVAMDCAQEQKQDTTAPEELVKRLPPVPAAECADKECSICLEMLNGLEDNVRLPCQHCFHRVCVENWLTKRRSTCPLCAAPVTVDSVSASEHSTEVGRYFEVSPLSSQVSP